MSNLFWYSMVAVIGIALGAVIMLLKRKTYPVSSFIVFFIFSACITWIGEFIALGLFNAYAYKPGLFTDRWAENLTGHLLLNTTIYPGLASLLAGFSLGWVALFIIVALLTLLEYWFVQMGLYEQHWWNYYMSVANMAIFLLVSRSWFRIIMRPPHRLKRNTVFYFISFFFLHLPFPFLLLMKKEYFYMDWLNSLVHNSYRASTIFSLTYHLIEASILLYLIGIKRRWYWTVTAYGVLLLSECSFAGLHLLQFQNGWHLPEHLLIVAASVSIFVLLDRFTVKPAEEFKPAPS